MVEYVDIGERRWQNWEQKTRERVEGSVRDVFELWKN